MGTVVVIHGMGGGVAWEAPDWFLQIVHRCRRPASRNDGVLLIPHFYASALKLKLIKLNMIQMKLIQLPLQ